MASVVNQRLRNALSAAELTQAQLAERVSVDAKSVERWITRDRMPHSTTRVRVVRLLGQDETYFWPQLLSTEQSRNASQAELVQIWPTRNTVPGEVWRSLFQQAAEQIDVLVYSGGFLVEAYDLVEIIRKKSAAGTNFRLLVGDSRSETVRQRGMEEGLPTLPQRCQSTLEYLSDVRELAGVDIRIHQTVLYVSQFRFDDAMLINNHTYGAFAAKSPIMHLRKVPGGQLFAYYAAAFDRVWETAQTLA